MTTSEIFKQVLSSLRLKNGNEARTSYHIMLNWLSQMNDEQMYDIFESGYFYEFVELFATNLYWYDYGNYDEEIAKIWKALPEYVQTNHEECIEVVWQRINDRKADAICNHLKWMINNWDWRIKKNLDTINFPKLLEETESTTMKRAYMEMSLGCKKRGRR